MIKHHPNAAILKDFVDGTLADSVSLIVSSHVELCEHCQEKVKQLTAEAANNAFDAEPVFSNEDLDSFLTDDMDFDFDAIDQITADASQSVEATQRFRK